MKKRLCIKLRTYPVIARAVEEGVAYGLQRYNKYNDPDVPGGDDAIAEHVEREVLNALCEVIEFDDTLEGK